MNPEVLRFYQSEHGYKIMTNWYDSVIKTFSFPYQSKYLDTRFGQTHYLSAGKTDHEAIILVQAIAGSAPLWYHQIPILAQAYHVIALDIPGQPGRSAPNPPPFLGEGYTDWLLDVLDGLGIEQANFAGVSSGGWYVLRFAIRHPQRILKMILLSPTGLANARFPLDIFFRNVLSKKKDDQALEEELSTRSFLPRSESENFDRNLARAMALATRHYRIGKSLDLYDQESGRLKLWNAIRILRTLFFAEPNRVLNSLKTPGLVILGEHEMLFNSEKVSRRVNSSIPALDAVVIEGTGHSAMYDRPDQVNQTILHFLKTPAPV